MTQSDEVEKLIWNIEETGDLSEARRLAQLVPEGVNWRTNITGDSLLHLAVRNNDTELSTYLIALGADVDAKCHKGRTPLHNAARTIDCADVTSVLRTCA